MLANAHNPETTALRPSDSLRQALSVLLVEDSEDDAFLLQRRIHELYPGSYFERVDCVEGMRRALSARDWHLIVSDHQMPSFDSLSALEVLKSSGKDIPFIIYSGDLPQQDGVHAMHGGAQDFVYKSAPERLLPVIERELANWQLRRDKEQTERSMEQLVNFDELTGLPNRSLFMVRVQEHLDAAASERAALCYLDLDRFMRINETFGYAAGDALIRQVGERLVECTGAATIARAGRDEFALHIQLPAHEQPDEVAERLMQCFAAPFSQMGQELYLTPSVGIAISPDHGTDVLSLIKSAESAMFDAKQSGRKTYQVYRPEINAGSRHRLALENGLRNAIERNELVVMYQPVFDMAHERILGTEALLRWHHPQLGVISPQEFIPIADETGLILPIGEWVLREACAQTRSWHDLGYPHLSVAVNVSATQFRDPTIAERIEAILRETRLPSHALELEITESVAMQDASRAGEIMARLKALGLQLAIDDFGTGYSSLAYLKRFPIDILKIDQSFVQDVNDDEDDAAIVRAILALTRSLKLAAHAEGIETADQAIFMLQEGCERLQGYLFGKPAPAEELLSMLIHTSRHPALRSIKLPEER
ncbi:MAG TPA: EAL domain-containing protein [Burkholderiales bacterium]